MTRSLSLVFQLSASSQMWPHLSSLSGLLYLSPLPSARSAKVKEPERYGNRSCKSSWQPAPSWLFFGGVLVAGEDGIAGGCRIADWNWSGWTGFDGNITRPGWLEAQSSPAKRTHKLSLQSLIQSVKAEEHCIPLQTRFIDCCVRGYIILPLIEVASTGLSSVSASSVVSLRDDIYAVFASWRVDVHWQPR